MSETGQNPYEGGDPQAELERRIDLLERENARLRRRMEGVLGPDNPCFDSVAFMKALRRYLFSIMLPMELMVPLLILVSVRPGILPTNVMLGPIPLFDPAGFGTSHPGIGMGIIAFGGLAVGVVAMGGGAIGVLAIGGGAVGVLALGGGSFGFIALGGGAVGYIAIGGGAVGRYALGGSGAGKAVFSLRRQDPEAVEFFVRWLPRLRAAVTTPLPVVPLEEGEGKHAS